MNIFFSHSTYQKHILKIDSITSMHCISKIEFIIFQIGFVWKKTWHLYFVRESLFVYENHITQIDSISLVLAMVQHIKNSFDHFSDDFFLQKNWHNSNIAFVLCRSSYLCNFILCPKITFHKLIQFLRSMVHHNVWFMQAILCQAFKHFYEYSNEKLRYRDIITV